MTIPYHDMFMRQYINQEHGSQEVKGVLLELRSGVF
jgi:hypothetical protein